MRKNHEIELKIEDMDFPSKGFGYYDGKKIYVKNTLPGQRVRAWITKIKRICRSKIARSCRKFSLRILLVLQAFWKMRWLYLSDAPL